MNKKESKMKVKELIEMLQDFNQEAEINFLVADQSHSDFSCKSTLLMDNKGKVDFSLELNEVYGVVVCGGDFYMMVYLLHIDDDETHTHAFPTEEERENFLHKYVTKYWDRYGCDEALGVISSLSKREAIEHYFNCTDNDTYYYSNRLVKNPEEDFSMVREEIK